MEAVWAVIGIVAGGLVTWWVSRHYFKRAGDELREEAEKLRSLQQFTIVALTDPKAKLKPKWDSTGTNVIGLILEMEGRASGGSSATANPNSPA